jgi:hypothetical protein
MTMRTVVATLAIGAVVVLVGACQGPAGTTPAPSLTTAATAEATTVPATTAPTPEPTPGPPLPGRLLFSRFVEATHTFQASYVSEPNGTGETEVPRPWLEGLQRWSRSGTEITVPTQLADGRIGTAIIAPDGNVLRVLEIRDPTLNLPCSAWSMDDKRLACEGWDDTDPSRRGIYTVRASDGGDIRRLTTPPEGSGDIPGDFSPDGGIVFKRGPAPAEGNGPLMLVAAKGGEPRQIGTGSSRIPGASRGMEP